MPAPARGRLLSLIATLLLVFAAFPARAIAPEAAMALCRNAAIAAADRHGVPREVMLAITQVETRTKRGGQSGPWPWTVNVAGKGDWFDSRAAALLHTQQALSAGQKSFDVGCFQLNYRWHGEHFASVDAMFEPDVSGDYAARFLKDLYSESGDWIVASGHYHSRTPVHANRYRDLVATTIGRMGGVVPEPVQVAALAAADLPEEGGRAAAGDVLRTAGIVQPRHAGAAPSAERAAARAVRPAAVRAPLVVRVASAGEGRAVHGVSVRTPRGTGRIDGAAMVLRTPAPEVLALR